MTKDELYQVMSGEGVGITPGYTSSGLLELSYRLSQAAAQLQQYVGTLHQCYEQVTLDLEVEVARQLHDEIVEPLEKIDRIICLSRFEC